MGRKGMQPTLNTIVNPTPPSSHQRHPSQELSKIPRQIPNRHSLLNLMQHFRFDHAQMVLIQDMHAFTRFDNCVFQLSTRYAYDPPSSLFGSMLF
mmetsp:Transcript_6855/g.14866  ORF Transcript_6855/g.14866 Transcript_6855/m.14866 type:complete len:95 (+) Transcript_6855:178-462(+)